MMAMTAQRRDRWLLGLGVAAVYLGLRPPLYQRDGYMCADLSNPDRAKWADPAHPTSEETFAAGSGTFAYCGHYEIDVKQRQLVHLPEVATDPGYVGSRQTRPYSFDDGRLVLGDVEKNDPAVAHWKIVWEKVR